MAQPFGVAVDVNVVRRSDCAVLAAFTAPARSRWSIVFAASGTPRIIDRTGMGMDAGPALEPDHGTSCRGAEVAVPLKMAARFSGARFVGAMNATSVLSVPVNGGASISTQVSLGVPGQTWSLDLYDHGTCDHVVDLVASLPGLTVGSSGARTQAVTLSSRLRTAVLTALATRKTLVLRMSSGSYRTCQRYYPV
jgi:hypothetical protein